MKINLIAARDGWLMSRVINELIKHPDITEGKPGSGINYYFPYYTYDGFQGTTAAMFTHREEHKDFQHRRDQWDNAAKNVSLRLPMSNTYAKILEPCGPTEVIELPVTKRLKRKKYTIGISGRLYPSDRKGRNLVEAVYNNLSNYIEFKFAGKGWDSTLGEVKLYKFEDMDKFYTSLDYYLCTSTVEGGPMPVKEAALCGVKVIAPKGVGFCEEYADYLYEKGNIDSLLETLKPLVVPKIDYESVNVEYWISQHINAFRKLC